MKMPSFTTQFKKDMKDFGKRGKDLTKIKAVMFDLICENPLPPKNNDHALHGGEFKNHRECHVEPDWLLVYMYKDEKVQFVRTGTHSDLF